MLAVSMAWLEGPRPQRRLLSDIPFRLTTIWQHSATSVVGSSTSFGAQSRTSAYPSIRTYGCVARSATKSADARRGAADDGELRQAAKPTASKGVAYKRDSSHRCGRCLSLRLVTIAQ